MKSNSVTNIKSVDPVRKLIHDISRLGKQKHHIFINAEVDITSCRRKLKKLSETVSLLSYFIYCYAQAIEKYKDLNSVIIGSRQHTFKEVDVSLIVERQVGDLKVPMNYIIRNCGGLSLKQIDDEIKIAKSTAIGEKMLDSNIKLFSRMPGLIRKLVWKIIMRNPKLMKEYLGTTGVTSAYNYSKEMFWGIPLSPLTTTLSIGSVYYKTVLENSVPIEKTKLCITLSVDHDVVDGGEAGRFMLTYSDYIKNSFGLESQ